MEFSDTWKSLLKPGEATDFFSLKDLKPFQITATHFEPINAWWLAELCRLIYKENRPERRKILDRVALREIEFFNRGGTQCAIIEPLNPKSPPFSFVVFRGTNEIRDWLSNLDTILVEWFPGSPERGSIHKGFADAFDFIWGGFFEDNLWLNLQEYLEERKAPLFYTGHSLGAALATLTASIIPPKALYTFGSPRVGDPQFAKSLAEVPIYRVVNNNDLVTTVPLPIKPFNYTHVGELHYLNRKSEIIKEPAESKLKLNLPNNEEVMQHIKNIKDWFKPLPFLSDHSPVNYVAHLEKQL